MKLVLLYLALVGTPLLGLLGILRIGETLDVPVSIGGTWTVEPATAQAIQRSCVSLELPDRDPEMTVSQSGRYVQVRFNDAARTSMIGRLRAHTLTVRQVLPSGAHVERICGATILTVMQVQLRRGSGDADRLSGWWRMPECDVCTAQPFHAVRLTAH